MSKILLFTFIFTISNIQNANANANATNPLSSCIAKLLKVRSEIKKIDSNAIEEVDGYQDPDLFEHINQCTSALAQAEGTLQKIKDCQQKTGYKPKETLDLNDIIEELTGGSPYFIDNNTPYDLCIAGREVEANPVKVNGDNERDQKSIPSLKTENISNNGSIIGQ